MTPNALREFPTREEWAARHNLLPDAARAQLDAIERARSMEKSAAEKQALDRGRRLSDLRESSRPR